MFKKILVVCVGNICRSPVAQSLLQQALPDKEIDSAGLAALVYQDVDPVARSVALAYGVSLPKHAAKQLTPQLCRQADLILVMENRHRDAIGSFSPEALGKVFLLGGPLGGVEIVDPYRRGREAFERIHKQISLAVDSWAKKLR